MTNMNLNWAGFSKKTFEERLQLIKQFELLTPEHLQTLEEDCLLPIETANQLTENVLGRFALPLVSLLIFSLTACLIKSLL